MIIPVVWLSLRDDVPHRGFWDQAFLEDLFSFKAWHPVGAPEFQHYDSLVGLRGAVVILPARSHNDYIDELNKQFAELEWLVLILAGDEGQEFDYTKLDPHPNMDIWVQSPNPHTHPADFKKLPIGYTPHVQLLPETLPEKDLHFSFAGQITHTRREACKEGLDLLRNKDTYTSDVIYTKGFTEGIPAGDYIELLARSQVVPCPSGPETPDTFRLYEALEAGVIPLVDESSPKEKFRNDDYWHNLFGVHPLITVSDWSSQILGYMQAALGGNRPRQAAVTSAWWQQQKRRIAYELLDSIITTANIPRAAEVSDLITVVMPTSPIPSHPSTEVIEQAIADIRSQLPDCEIIITADGIRKEQYPKFRRSYVEYLERLAWLCARKWSNVVLHIFDDHLHQAEMMRRILPQVKTPTLLYVEHDAPITPDRDIPWRQMIDAVTAGEANVIRLHHEPKILDEHRHLVIGDIEEVNTVPMIRTAQWSQRPHVASTEFYRHILDTWFQPEWRTMIEDRMHGVIEISCREGGYMAWLQWRLWLFTPEGDMKRSYHLDGRGDEPKFEMWMPK